jgi:hypothetical protein
MPETVNLLETAFAGEVALLKKMIDQLEGEDMRQCHPSNLQAPDGRTRRPHKLTEGRLK